MKASLIEMITKSLLKCQIPTKTTIKLNPIPSTDNQIYRCELKWLRLLHSVGYKKLDCMLCNNVSFASYKHRERERTFYSHEWMTWPLISKSKNCRCTTVMYMSLYWAFNTAFKLVCFDKIRFDKVRSTICDNEIRKNKNKYTIFVIQA